MSFQSIRYYQRGEFLVLPMPGSSFFCSKVSTILFLQRGSLAPMVPCSFYLWAFASLWMSLCTGPYFYIDLRVLGKGHFGGGGSGAGAQNLLVLT